MYYRKLGNTGLEVSELSFGTIPILQGNIPVLPAYFNLDESEALAVMAHAFQMGCNLFDTAIVPEYGDAEIKLGKFAACVGRERIIISDKARFFGGGEMYRAVETSCENLGTVPDLYFVHQVDASHEEEVFARGGALDALAELKAEGKIRFAGIATHYYDILLRGAQDERVDVLQGSGNLQIENTVGKTAEVYLTVPAARSGAGKVNVYVQERYAEMEAVTDSAAPLKTGERVKIVGTMGEGTVVVAPFAVTENKEEE